MEEFSVLDLQIKGVTQRDVLVILLSRLAQPDMPLQLTPLEWEFISPPANHSTIFQYTRRQKEQDIFSMSIMKVSGLLRGKYLLQIKVCYLYSFFSILVWYILTEQLSIIRRIIPLPPRHQSLDGCIGIMDGSMINYLLFKESDFEEILLLALFYNLLRRLYIVLDLYVCYNVDQ